MQIYLVGGAVRDELLGLPVKERDWVVVGASPEELLKLGYIPVGKDFPVFLHPRTHEEYALARTERKTGKGYKGFAFHADPKVTLEEDLVRRDLTINAMARGLNHELIDPFSGQQDLHQHLLRHVSAAFVEDPVRILRVARFASKLAGFRVASETTELMQAMVQNGEVNALVSERVWQEFERALCEKNPNRFFEVLQDCRALAVLFPEINIEGKGCKALEIATEFTDSGPIRFAALLHDLPESLVKNLNSRLRAPREYTDLAILVAKWFSTDARIFSCDAITILNLLKSVDAFRRPERFQQFLYACRAGLIASQQEFAAHEQLLNKIYQALKNIDVQSLVAQKLAGKDLAEKIQLLQIEKIESVMGIGEK